MHMRLNILSLALIAALLVGCQSSGTTTTQRPVRDTAALIAATTDPVTVLNRFNGSDPSLKERTVFLVNSRKQLEQMGATELAKLDVNYSTNSLLVLALGEEPTGGFWGRIDAVQQRGDTMFVQGVANRPGDSETATQAVTYPFDAVLIPKTQAAIIYPEIESVSGQAQDAAPAAAAPAPAAEPAAAPAADTEMR